MSDGSGKKKSTKRKIILNKGSDVYLASTNTQLNQDVYFIDSRESYHMTPHKEWFCEYDRYDEGDVFLGDDEGDVFRRILCFRRICARWSEV